ncbi:DsbA family protein [Candidatus Gracilibacteria bacterium]|nr:DsbA family protein [Candidatus Gracilibacteria bacterium]
MKKIHHQLQTIEGKFIAGVLLVIVLLFAYYFFAKPADVISNTTEEITISKTDHVRGAQDGILTLVVFGDFQCPACAAYEPLVQQVVEDNKTIVKSVYKHFPLTQIHQNAMIAAKASEAAALQGKFWEMHDLLYEKQKDWSLGINAYDVLLTYATTLGLDTNKFKEDLNNKEIEDKIFAEYKEGVRLGVQGTPTFFLNGKKLESPTSLESFNRLILETAANLPK